MTRRIVVTCLLCGLSVLCGCFEGPTGPQGEQGEKGDTVLVKEESSIVGIWSDYNNSSRKLIFRSDGSYYSYEDGTGIYELSGDTVTFKAIENGIVRQTSIYKYILAIDFLTLKEEYIGGDGNTYYIIRDYIRIVE